MKLEEIQLSKGGYQVKSLVYKPKFGIITGLIKANINKDIRNDGWVGCCWTYTGVVNLNKSKKTRLKINDDFNLDISN